MSVALNGSAGAKHYCGTSSTSFPSPFSFTVSPGSNLALVLTLNFGSVSVSGVTATWDVGGTNQAMTQKVFMQSTQSQPATSVIFVLRAPTVGTLNCQVSWTGASECFAALVCFSGVDQTSDVTAFPHTSGFTIATNPGTSTLTSASGNMVVGCQAATVGTAVPTGTTIYEDHASGTHINVAAEYDNGAATVVIGNSTTQAVTAAAVDIGAAVFSQEFVQNQFLNQAVKMAAIL